MYMYNESSTQFNFERRKYYIVVGHVIRSLNAKYEKIKKKQKNILFVQLFILFFFFLLICSTMYIRLAVYIYNTYTIYVIIIRKNCMKERT